ncbi:MAG: BolA family transcriptional regulator [Myxococcales bacterium]|nr:BolA family transcriptional regulator [Myxococcales bacterium]
MSLEEIIEAALEDEFQPTHVEVLNESHKHNVAPGSESHFKVTLVCAEFEGKTLIARHRAINAIVDMKGRGIHALALHAYAPSEWEPNDALSESPDCHGAPPTKGHS